MVPGIVQKATADVHDDHVDDNVDDDHVDDNAEEAGGMPIGATKQQALRWSRRRRRSRSRSRTREDHGESQGKKGRGKGRMTLRGELEFQKAGNKIMLNELLNAWGTIKDLTKVRDFYRSEIGRLRKERDLYRSEIRRQR